MVRTKKPILGAGMVIATHLSTPSSRAAWLAACSSSAACISGSIPARAARATHNATLDGTFAINPTIDEIQFKDDVDAEAQENDNYLDDLDAKVQVNCNDEDDANATAQI